MPERPAENTNRSMVVAASATRRGTYLWSFVSLGMRIALQFAATTILARALGAETFGLGNAASVIGAVVFAIAGMGLNASLVVRKAVSRGFLCRILVADLAIGAALALMLVNGARYYADAIALPDVAPLVSLLALGLIGSLFSGPSLATLARDLAFGRIALVEVVSVTSAALVAVALATAGRGAVAVVALPVVTELALGLLAPLALLWRTRTDGESPARLDEERGHLYSARSMGVVVLSQVSRNVDNVLVAGLLGASALAYYSVAYRLMLIPVLLVTTAIARVALPTLRRVAGAGGVAMRAESLGLMGAVCFASVPVLTTVYIYSDAVVVSLYGAGWKMAAEALRILVFAAFFQVLTGIVAAILQAATNMRALWWSNVVYAPAVAGGAVLGAASGVEGVCLAYAIVSGLNLVWHTWLAQRAVGLTSAWFWTALRPSLLPAVLCLAGGAVVKAVVTGDGLLVVIAVTLLTMSYLVAAIISKSGRKAALNWLHMLGVRTLA